MSYGSQIPWSDLFDALHRYDGADAYDDVLEPWLQRDASERRWLDEFRQRTRDTWTAATGEDLCRLYAIFRLTSMLLLRFQAGRKDGTDWQGPRVSMEGFQIFHEGLGFQVSESSRYHPFFHEIVGVHQSSPESAPVQLDRQMWPALMLDNMLFCRAGCVVAGGTNHVIKEVAEASTPYWTYRRKDRPYQDLSHGWGSRSQWRTDLRRDYRTNDAYYYNVDADESLNGMTGEIEGLAVETMIEVVRNRCVITKRINDHDLYPYRYRSTEPIADLACLK